ncbi:MAG: VOC family protein [Gammaproteobacteria bacterium]|nr:VOC family protein [Gammaproteobacteria bacterium]
MTDSESARPEAARRRHRPAPPGTDHLVYAVPDLEAGVRDLEARLGARQTPGGSHPGLGTRNSLLRLGGRVYLEVIGPDPEQPAPSGGLWFTGGRARLPALVTWAVRSVDLDGLAAGPGGHLLGPVRSMSRIRPGGDRIAWTLTMPRKPFPRQGIIPFFIDWGDTPHPCAELPDRGVRLVRLSGRHPDPELVRRELGRLGVELEVAAERAGLVAVLQTPAGDLVTL